MKQKIAKTPQTRQKGIRPALLVRLDAEDHLRLDDIRTRVPKGPITKQELVRRIVKEYFARIDKYEAKMAAARAA